jgi:HEAT repeat protein
MAFPQAIHAIVLLLGATAGVSGAGVDEAMLKAAGVATDDAGLLRFLRNKAVPPQFDFATLTRQLGSNAFKEREEASEKLIAAGRFALPALREVQNDPDPEIARRASECLAIVEKEGIYSPPDLASAAVRLVVRRAPAGAVVALLDYLPHAPPGAIEEEVWFGLDTLVRKAGTVPVELAAALSAREPARRAAAACIVGRVGSTAQKDTVRRLLGDTSPTLVRLRGAQGLLAGGDTSGVPALIALLAEAPVEEAWQAEELLHWLAGDTAPPPLKGAFSKEARTQYQVEWQGWHRKHGAGADSLRALKEPRRPGLLLICADKVYGSVSLYGCDGRPHWQLNRPGEFNDVCLLPGPRVLAAEGNSVREFDLAGEAVVKFAPEEDDPLLLCQPLPGSNRLLVTWRHLFEVTRDGKVRHRRDMRSRHESLERAPDGRLVALYPFGRISGDLRPGLWAIDRSGPEKDRKILQLGHDGEPFRFARAEPLPDGYLIAGPDLGKVVEIDAAGRTVWQARLNARLATRWRDNWLAFCGDEAGRLVEIDRQGRVVWEAFPAGHVQRVRPCLGLVRLGFPTGELDIDRSVAYRVRGLKNKDTAERRRAIERLQQMGRLASDAVPALAEALGDTDTEVRRGAIRVLELVGPGARAAVPKLIDVLDDPDERPVLTRALQNIGPAAVPALLQALKDRRPRVRAGAVLTLGLLHDELDTVPAELLAARKDADEAVRLEVIRALGAFVVQLSSHKPDAQPRDNPSLARRACVTALLEALADDSVPVRRQAALSLAGLDATAEGAVPALRRALQSKDRDLQGNVLRALGALGRHDKTVLPVLLEGLRNNDAPDNQAAATDALGAMGANAAPAVPDLMKVLRDQPGGPDIPATHALAHMGSAAVPDLVEELLRGSPRSRLRALAVVAAMGRPGRAALPHLVKLLNNEAEDVRQAAAQALGSLGADAATAAPAVLDALRAKRIATPAALETLGRIAAPDREVLSFLLDVLTDSKAPEHDRCAAAWALGLLGPEARDAVPALLDVLAAVELADQAPGRPCRRELENYVANPASSAPTLQTCATDARACALIALTRIGPGARAATQALFKLCTDPSAGPFERWAAAEALARIRPNDAEVSAALRCVLRDAGTLPPVQVGVVHALAAIGTAAEVPVLTDAASTGDRPVRLAARSALQQLKQRH